MIRRNILTSPAAVQQFVDGLLLLKDPARNPWPGQEALSMYDFFVFWHHRAMMLRTPPTQLVRNAAHMGSAFLPWHRYMLLMLEQFLRDALQADDFRLPYWDWASDAELADPRTSPLWSGTLLGRFSQPDWRVRLGPNPTGRNPAPVDRPLQRDIGREGRLSRHDQLRALVQNNPVYDQIPFDITSGGLRNNLEGNVGVGHHNAVHNWIGGDMAASTSPNDPAFYLVHCNVDRVWTAWQRQHPGTAYVPPQTASADLTFHRIDDVMHTFFDDPLRLTIAQVLDVSERYTYDTLDDLVPLVA